MRAQFVSFSLRFSESRQRGRLLPLPAPRQESPAQQLPDQSALSELWEWKPTPRPPAASPQIIGEIFKKNIYLSSVIIKWEWGFWCFLALDVFWVYSRYVKVICSRPSASRRDQPPGGGAVRLPGRPPRRAEFHRGAGARGPGTGGQRLVGAYHPALWLVLLQTWAA